MTCQCYRKIWEIIVTRAVRVVYASARFRSMAHPWGPCNDLGCPGRVQCRFLSTLDTDGLAFRPWMAATLRFVYSECRRAAG